MNQLLANLKRLHFEVGIPLHELCELAKVNETELLEILTEKI